MRTRAMSAGGEKNAADSASVSESDQIRELTVESDFHEAADPDGRIAIIGFGSLLSEPSALTTFPRLLSFQAARLKDFRRVFCHAAPVFFERGIANGETREYSSLSVEPCEGEEIVVTHFTIPTDEVPSFIEREHEFRFLLVPPQNITLMTSSLTSSPIQHGAVICSRYSDEEYRRVRLGGDPSAYERLYGRWGVETIWDDTLLPCRVYLRHCVLAARSLGTEAHRSFLEHTFLADRTTTIKQHLLANPAIMTELPPPSLADRYGG